MPTYDFEHKKTKERHTKMMSYTDKLQYLEDNPDLTSIILVAPSLGDSHRLGLKKPTDGFRDVLREVQKAHPINNINTF
jgi:hypothetical protein